MRISSGAGWAQSANSEGTGHVTSTMSARSRERRRAGLMTRGLRLRTPRTPAPASSGTWENAGPSRRVRIARSGSLCCSGPSGRGDRCCKAPRPIQRSFGLGGSSSGPRARSYQIRSGSWQHRERDASTGNHKIVHKGWIGACNKATAQYYPLARASAPFTVPPRAATPEPRAPTPSR